MSLLFLRIALGDWYYVQNIPALVESVYQHTDTLHERYVSVIVKFFQV